ncbi:DUF7344 domain-containing protein [Haladaptatus caseinilyticus]|uniref:DUF7344 domain-containing protein n=1 Tax=Haladaptatus caseinilyticus TaxID=2993314 RepID=UPI00224B8990|nr:hypothetical protein [Haladaptatus caseinilyticus]
MQSELHGKSTRLDTVFDALSSAYRRRLLSELLNGECDLHDFTRRLKGEYGGERKHIELALYAIHLPKLDELELVEWHEGTDEVRRGDRFRDVRPILERFES